MISAFDADVIIYAAAPDHPLGRSVSALFAGAEPGVEIGVGSVLLRPETLIRPRRRQQRVETAAITALLAHLDLRPVEGAVSSLATALGVRHGLRAADAIHLATAILAGADRFITSNTKDFTPAIGEIDIVTPADLDASSHPARARRPRSHRVSGRRPRTPP